jgi:hypothetical protein
MNCSEQASAMSPEEGYLYLSVARRNQQTKHCQTSTNQITMITDTPPRPQEKKISRLNQKQPSPHQNNATALLRTVPAFSRRRSSTRRFLPNAPQIYNYPKQQPKKKKGLTPKLIEPATQLLLKLESAKEKKSPPGFA